MNKLTRVQTALSLTAMSSMFLAPSVLAEDWNHGVNDRQQRQQQRIMNGVNSGQLTGQEVHRLERAQDMLRDREARMRANGGGLSPEERNRLEREQNALSHDIRHQEHDGQTQLNPHGPGWQQNQAGFNKGYNPSLTGHSGWSGQPGGGINNTQESQQLRIQQGLQSGQLTRHEYERLQEKQARFAQLEAQLRATGGGISPSERSQLQFEQRQLSQEIERQKHDSQVR